MKEIQCVVEIHTPKEKVWDTLWQDETFRQWAGIIDSGTHNATYPKVLERLKELAARE